MKRNLLVFIALVLPFVAAAQGFSAMTFKEAQQKASAQKKIILVDVTSARMMNDQKLEMEKRLFAVEGVGEFVDNNAIAVRVDMGAPEGKDFAPLLQMNMYPTYAFMMPNGDLLGVVSPYALDKDPSLFLERANGALEQAREKWSNSKKILFSEASFEEALKLAKKEGKLVFIDAYTDNCQPCIMMEKNVFTLDRVADFYNEKFVNLSLNLGTVHTSLAERYNTFAYPTYLFVDGDGELLFSGSGFMEGDKFLELGQQALASRGIRFTEGSWSEILELAKKEEKPIFVDCYTVWCGPCKVMARDVFTDPVVGDYFNANFINVKIDMEKGEGIDLKNHYEVAAFPTFLYLDKDGNVVNRIVGSMPAAKFLEESKRGMSEHGLLSLSKKYAAGERSRELVFDYLKALETGYMQKEAAVVANDYLASLDLPLIKERENWALFMRYANDADSEVFKYVHANKGDFHGLFGEQMVDRKLFDIWTLASRKFVSGQGSDVVFDGKGYNKFLKRLRKERVKDADLLELNADMFYAEMTDDWDGFYDLASAKIDDAGGLEQVPVHELHMWGVKIEEGCEDRVVRRKAADWFAVMAPVVVQREARRREEAKKSGGVMAMSMINYEKEFQRLLEVLSE
jgi:thioredoxin-related protein